VQVPSRSIVTDPPGVDTVQMSGVWLLKVTSTARSDEAVTVKASGE
jgi:hypothetical protein